MKAAVIGAGISGLTTGYLLKQSGFDVTIYEKSNNSGGNIRTEKAGGFLIEHGPNSTLETTPLLNQLFEELGIAGSKIYASEISNKRYILKYGKLLALPMSPVSFLSSGLFSLSAKLRLLKEPFIKSKSSDTETIAEFTERRLGREFLDYAINPFVAGVFAGNPNEINVKASFPKLFELEQKYGSLIGGTIKSGKERKKRKEQSKQSAKSFSFQNGLSEIVEALRKSLDDNIKYETEVTGLSKIDDSYELMFALNGSRQTELYDLIIVSVPSFTASRLVDWFDSALAAELENIYYPPVTVVYTGFSNDAFAIELDGFGFLVPEKENRKILGSLWSSSIFPGRAAEGFGLLTNFVGGSRSPELALEPDDKITNIVLDELRSVMGIRKDPGFVKVVRWEKAIPQYSRSHAKLTDRLEKFMDELPGLFICSNFYRGISISDCITNAYKTAEKAQQYSKNFMKKGTHAQKV